MKMNARCARSVDRCTELLAKNYFGTLGNQFKTPQYSGSGDVEYFISWFQKVAKAND